jgi:hypothetical protein
MMSDAIREIKLELFTKQSEIIQLQSEAIDDLFRVLVQHLEAEELDRLPALEKMNRAAMIRREMEL